jgi:hypothetical protein
VLVVSWVAHIRYRLLRGVACITRVYKAVRYRKTIGWAWKEQAEKDLDRLGRSREAGAIRMYDWFSWLGRFVVNCILHVGFVR